MLESADTEVVGSGVGPAAIAVEEPPPEVFEKRKIPIVAWIAIGWLIFVVLISILAPFLAMNPTNGFAGDYAHANAGLFSAATSGQTYVKIVPGHALGTDASGRDVLANVMWGAQASLLIGVGSIIVGTLFGGLLGLIAGYVGGVVDTIINACFNILLAFPQLVLALTLVSVFSPNKSGGGQQVHWLSRIVVVIAAVGLVSIPILGRITRANALAWSQREFVMAAKAQGASSPRVMFREVLPNVMPAMLSIALLGVAVVIVLEGALAIFGLSVPDPNVSWGNMINSQLSALDVAPTVWLVPSILIFLSVLSLNYLGDVVRSFFDVRESALG